MSKILDNVHELEKILNNMDGNMEEPLEFLEAIKDDVEDLQNTIEENKGEISTLEDEIHEYETTYGEKEVDSEIEAGIGSVEFVEPDFYFTTRNDGYHKR